MFFGEVAHAQTLVTLVGKAAQYTANHPVEKAYLQLDKPYYASGDTIYFKGYITFSPEHKLSEISGVLHAELIAPGGKPVRTEQLQMVAGTAWGDFILADSLKAGIYRLRAYTNWMRNEGEGSFFEQAIAIGSTAPGKPGNSAKHTTGGHNGKPNQPDVQFLPEGGSLVAGVRSRVAVKCVNANGLGQDISGTIEDETGNVVAELTTRHLGMGVFALMPQSSKSYKAKINIPGEASFTVPLPKAQEQGYTLSIYNSRQDSILVRIAANEKTLAANKDKTLYLIAQSGGKVYYAAEAKLEKTAYMAAVAKSRFPTGIVLFTLLSSGGEPLNERLAFIDNHDLLKLELKTKKKTYAAREKTELTLNAKDRNGKAVSGSFSVSVTDESKLPADTIDENNILSNLLLTSELKGTVEQPAYYFSNQDEKTAADLDNLLLTQGYHQFEWKRALSNEQAPVQYAAERSLAISGTVKKNGKPLPNTKVTLFNKTGGVFVLDTLTDNKGRFAFRDLLFADSTKFLVQAKVDNGQENVTLELDTPAAPRPGIINQTIREDQTDLLAYTENARAYNQELQKYGINKHAIALKEVKIASKRERIIPHSQNLNGAGIADYVFGPREVAKMICGRIIDCLQGVIPGVTFDAQGYPLNNRVIDFMPGTNNNQLTVIDHRMAIVIDGQFVDADVFSNLRPDDIEGIEVIKGPVYGAVYGSRMAKGGLIITTKRASKPTYTFESPGVITCMPSGIYKAREFYSPRYDNPKNNKSMADLRTTICWQPNVITGKDGKATFSYFNADGKGIYRIVIEGIGADGNLGRQVYRYEVR
jgi:hypothetical protein